MPKECLKNSFTESEDKAIPFFIPGEEVTSCTKYCKVFINPQTMDRVLDSPGLENTLDKGQSVYETNLAVIRQILHAQEEHKMKFARVLYFIPERGPLEVADKGLQQELEVMYGFFGRQIFNVMVIIATNNDSPQYQTLEFSDKDKERSKVAFMTAVEIITKESFKRCPPILYLPVGEEDVLGKVKSAKVLDDAPLSALVGDRCAKCAKRLIYVNGEITRVIENEGLRNEKGVDVDESLCHPYFTKPWYRPFSEEKCARCQKTPGSKGCMKNKARFQKKGSDEYIEVRHVTTIQYIS